MAKLIKRRTGEKREEYVRASIIYRIISSFPSVLSNRHYDPWFDAANTRIKNESLWNALFWALFAKARAVAYQNN